LHVTLSEAQVVHLADQDDVLRLAVPVEARSYELHGLAALGGEAFRWQDLRDAADTATAVAFDGPLTGGVDKRLLTVRRAPAQADADRSIISTRTPTWSRIYGLYFWPRSSNQDDCNARHHVGCHRNRIAGLPDTGPGPRWR